MKKIFTIVLVLSLITSFAISFSATAVEIDAEEIIKLSPIEYNADQAKIAQLFLKEEGYYNGLIDGEFGKKSNAARDSYFEEHPIEVNTSKQESIKTRSKIKAGIIIMVWLIACFCAGCRKGKNKRNKGKNKRNRDIRASYAKPQASYAKPQASNKRKSFSKEFRLAILNRDNYKCQNPHCRNPHNHGSYDHHTHLHIDHIIPVSKGGTNDPHNLQVLCAECNIKKSNKY